jgi:hypothetical protein
VPKLNFKHGYRRQREDDGLPSIRQQELARRVTHDERVKAEKKRVEDGKEEAARKGREERELIRMRKAAR